MCHAQLTINAAISVLKRNARVQDLEESAFSVLLTQTALPQQQPDAVQVINVRNALIPVSVLVFHRHQFATLQLEHAYNVLWMQIVLWLKLRDVVAAHALVLLA